MKRWKLIAGVFVLACLLTDLFPRYGPPAFRYTGSDPRQAVWNLGWPLPLAIYDARSGFHVGPVAYAVLPVQFLAFAADAVALVAACRRRQPSPPGTVRAGPI